MNTYNLLQQVRLVKNREVMKPCGIMFQQSLCTRVHSSRTEQTEAAEPRYCAWSLFTLLGVIRSSRVSDGTAGFASTAEQQLLTTVIPERRQVAETLMKWWHVDCISFQGGFNGTLLPFRRLWMRVCAWGKKPKDCFHVYKKHISGRYVLPKKFI